ncbi:hypothetical protein JCM21900_000553 [Sporobolomyces salmonicolor]
MAKRGASNELNQDNWRDSEDDGAEEGQQGDFKKADSSAIAGRTIRGLPKPRRTVASAPAADGPPKPSPFAFGAGAPAGSPNPFAALSVPTTSAAAPGAPANPFGAFAPATTAPKAAINGSPAAAPSFSFGATSSFGSSTAAASTPFAFGTTVASKPTAATPATTQTSAALKYYTSLRGLNLSLTDVLSKELEKDPFVDLGEVLVRLKSKYEEHRGKVQKEYSGAQGEKEDAKDMEVDKPTSSAALPPVPAVVTTPPAVAPNLAPKPSKSDAPAATPGPAPPAPPATFSFAGSTFKPAVTTTSAPTSGGFVPKTDLPADPYAEKSAFKFPVATPAPAPSTSTASDKPVPPAPAPAKPTLTAPSAPKLAPAKLTNPPAKPSPLRFGQSVSPPSSPASAEKKADLVKPKSNFSFGAAFGSIAKGEEGKSKDETVAEEKEEKKDEPVPKPLFSFAPSTPAASTSASTLGSAVSPPAKPFAFAAPTPFSTPVASNALSNTSKTSASPPIAISFGASSPPTFGFGAALVGKDKNKAFGASKATGFGFGSSIGTSPTAGTGFTFGAGAAPAAKKEGEGEEKKNTPKTTTTGFAFGSSASSTSFAFAADKPAASAPAAETPSADATPAPSDTESATSQTPGGNPFQATAGVGEEGETAFYTARAKVWTLSGPKAEGGGIAVVSIKEREEDGKKKLRLLGRTEVNGKVVINFSLYPDLAPVVEEEKFVRFMGFDEKGQPASYRLLIKKELVGEFVAKLKEAVEMVK